MIFVGLGSNLGHRKQNLRKALDALTCGKFPLLTDIKVSSIYESQALLPAGAPDSWNNSFFNLVVSGKSEKSPLEFLDKIKQLENFLGRKPSERWAPRKIDIDILAWGDLVLDCEKLVIPHPGLLERAFTLLPIAEISPEWTYPKPGNFHLKTALDLCQRLPAQLKEIKISPQSVFDPELVGILNVTPDSFSDGNLYLDSDKAAIRAAQLVRDGATVIDIGAESTRPGSSSISANEEWRRLDPVLREVLELNKKKLFSVSVDTYHPQTADKSLSLGVDWINDVTGFQNSEMQKVVAHSDCKLVFMHHLGVPPTKENILDPSVDVIDFLNSWAKSQIKLLSEKGIDKSRLIFDPGIGFGKSATQSFRILKHASDFFKLGVPLMVGHSRKSFLAKTTPESASDRDVETLTLSLELARQGTHYLRVHNVDWHARSFAVRTTFDRNVFNRESLG